MCLFNCKLFNVFCLGHHHGSTLDHEMDMYTTPPKITKMDVDIPQLIG